MQEDCLQLAHPDSSMNHLAISPACLLNLGLCVTVASCKCCPLLNLLLTAAGTKCVLLVGNT